VVWKQLLSSSTRRSTVVIGPYQRATLSLFSGPGSSATFSPCHSTPTVVRRIQRPPQRRHADAEQQRRPGLRFRPLCDQLPRIGDLMPCQFRRPADMAAPALCRLHPGARAFSKRRGWALRLKLNAWRCNNEAGAHWFCHQHRRWVVRNSVAHSASTCGLARAVNGVAVPSACLCRFVFTAVRQPVAVDRCRPSRRRDTFRWRRAGEMTSAASPPGAPPDHA
jgi:hypothetical protein